MHSITPGSKHIIVPATLAIHSEVTDIDAVADGLNELLRSSVEARFLADYAFVTQNNALVTASIEPEEGELFESLNEYVVTTVDSEHNEDSIRIKTEINLTAMSKPELVTTLSKVMVISEDDEIRVADINAIPVHTL